MTTWIDFKALRARVSMEDVLFRYYALDGMTRRGNKVVGPCPVHRGDSPRAFSADLSRDVYFCFTKCRDGGNQLDLVSRREAITIREAALRLQAWADENGITADVDDVGGPPPKPARAAEPAAPSKAKRRKPATVPAGSVSTPTANPLLDLNLDLAHDHPHIIDERKLAIETAEHFNVGYCRRGVLRGMIALPIHNREGQLVAYAGRRLRPQVIREKGKYKFPATFRRSLELYNLHRVLALDAPGPVVVVEGFFSVLALHEAGVSAVATMGVAVSDEQLALLATLPRIIIMFDGDEAGDHGGRELLARLEEPTRAALVELPVGLEPEDLPPRALRWLVAGIRELHLPAVSLRGGAFQLPPRE